MKTWLVNTNSKEESGNPNAFKYMLRQNKAAAFYGRANKIDQIDKGDLVLLYHNDNRIIAVGSVLTQFKPHDFEDMNSIEHWVDVNWLWKTNFDENYNPTNSIDRTSLGITEFRRTVIDVTEQVNYRELFTQISNRQTF